MSESQLANLEGKLDSTGDLGKKCQDQSIAANLKTAVHKNTAEALSVVAKKMQSELEKALKKEWDDGQFSECNTPEAARDWVLKTIARASGFCDHVAAISKNHELIASGEAAALQRVTALIGKHNDNVVSQIRQLQSPKASPDPESPETPSLDGKGNPRRRPGEAPLSVPAMAAIKAKAKADEAANQDQQTAATKAKKTKSKKKAAKKTAKKKGRSRKS